jgi:hypothetical protein
VNDSEDDPRAGLRKPLLQRLLGFPSSRPGWWSVILFLVFVVLMAALRVLARWSPRTSGSSFFSNPILAVTILAAGVAAVAGGAAGIFSVTRRGERALLVFFTILWSLMVIVFALGELGEN